jgi:effector-binding domain-containing protein
MLTYEIAMRELDTQPTAVVRTELPAEDLAGWLSVAYHAVVDYLRRRGTHPAGPPFARIAFQDGTVAAEAGFPVTHEVAGDGYVEASVLPGGPAAVTTHLGRYENLEVAYRAVRDWVADHGYVPAGPQWEVYHTDPTAEPNPERWRTDVVLPCRATPRE